MNPSLRDQLKQWKNDHLKVKQERKSKPVKRKPVKKQSEKLSERDLHDLMDTNRRFYIAARAELINKIERG